MTPAFAISNMTRSSGTKSGRSFPAALARWISPAKARKARSRSASKDLSLGKVRVCAMQARDRGFTDVLTRTFPNDKSFEADRDRAFRAFAGLIQRAKAAGKLRPDFVPEDLVMLLMANAGVISATSDAAPETSPRLVAYFLQACAADAARPLPAPPTQRGMYRALRRLHQ